MARIVERLQWWLDVQPKLTPTAKALLALQVLDLVNANLQHWHSTRTMAEMLNVSERSLRRAQQELEAEGLIHREARYREGRQSRESNLITVLVADHPP